MIYVSDTTRIRFRHAITNTDKEIFAMAPVPNMKDFGFVKGFTECFIETEMENGSWCIWFEGHAICSWEDNFDRAIGRKVALARALKHIEEKSLRKDFWEAYFRKVKR
jgi:hypothetical protein